jgi:hypothetical protein
VLAGGRAPHGKPQSSSNAWRRENHRIDVPPYVPSRRDRGFVEPGSYVRYPAGVGFSIVTVPVVFAPPRFSRRLPCPVRRSTTG